MTQPRNNWPMRPIGEIGEVLGGRQRSHRITKGATCPYLRVANVFQGRISFSNVLEMPFTEAEFQRFSLRKGDILFNEGQSLELVGRNAQFAGPDSTYAFQNTLVRFRPGASVLPGFAKQLFEYMFYAGRFRAIARQTTSIAHLGSTRLAKMLVPVPPIDYQRKAVNVLSTVDRAMERTGRLIEAKRQLKKGLAQQLLTGQRRLPGFGEPVVEGKTGKESKCGWIPSDWDCVHLRDIARLNPDTLPESTPEDYSFWYIDLSMVKQGVVDFPADQIRFGDAPSRARRVVSKGDITMATVRPNLRGYAFWPDEVRDVVCSTGFAVVRVTDASAPFVYQWLYSIQVARYFYGCIAGTGYPALNPGDVESIAVPCPPRKEQDRIAAVLGAADREIVLLEKKLAALAELKRGLMQALLTPKHLTPIKGA